MFNWNSNFLLPKFLSSILPENIYKPKYLKDFIIVSMLRNYITIDSKTNENISTIIANKYLITKAIDTSNLTIKTHKIYKDSSYTYKYKCEIFKIIIHINNKFNPTNINLLNNETQVHLYQLEGDQTLHINLNLKTLFNILTNDLERIKIKSFCEDYALSNSKLSWFISELILVNPITYYEKDSSDNWVEAGISQIDNTEKTFGSGYYFNSETETFWKFELGDILIFYHNLWWSSILMLFYLYNIPVWGGKTDLDQNTNKYRLKTNILQLLGGFSKVHMLENIQRSLKDHYAIVDKIFFLFKGFEKELVKLENSKDYSSSYFITTLQDLFLETNNSLQFTNNLITSITQLIFDNKLNLDSIESNDSDLNLSSDEISQLNIKKPKLNLNLQDHANLDESFNEFKISYKFNNLLLYILSLELIIKLISEKISLIIENKPYNEPYLLRLENILLVTVINYFKIMNEYNSIIELKTLQISVPKNLPNPFNKYSENCYCNHFNKSTNSFSLLLSGYNIKYNLYSTSELKTFCGSYCSNANSILSSKSSQINKNNFNNPKRDFSTSNISKIKFNHSNKNNNLLKSMQDKEGRTSMQIERKSKVINYNKSIFSILEKIKSLTQNNNYKPQEVQLKIENLWTDILKEKYSDNIYNSIKDIQPKIYEIFVTKDPKALKFVFPDLYLFLDDIKIYLTTYSVITTYFRRASRTAICSLVGDQILFFIYQTYFYPIIKDSDKGIKNIKIKNSKSKKEYDKVDIFNSLTKNKKDKLLKLIEVSKFKKENFIENNKLNKIDVEALISSVIFILEKILLRKGLKTLQDVKYRDFVEQVCFYFNPSYGNIEYFNLNMELNKDLEVSIFKIKLGERFVYAFEDANIIKNMWRNGMRSIDIFNSSQNPNDGPLTLDFNENIIQENIDKLTNILPTNLPLICQPNKWSDSEYGGYLNNLIEKKELITGIGANNYHKINNLKSLYNAVNYLNSLKFRVNVDLLDFVLVNKKLIFKNYYYSDKTLSEDKINDNILRDFVTLEIAKTFSNIPFYLNTFADWRGRIYTNSYYLSYQGSDLSLALLQFDEGQLISKSGEYFFKVYGANLHDENKISRAPYKDRIKWVDDNENNILNMDVDFIMKADSRFAFISFCLAYRRFKAGKRVHLPIWLDATCSGIQHFATMLKDVELAKSVNVISDPNSSGLNEKVRDIYSEMIEPTYKKIKDFVDHNPSFFKLLNVNITRKLIKPTIMTRVYNVTVKGVCGQLI